MTVVELIAILSTLPGDYPVQCLTPLDDESVDGQYSDVITANTKIRRGQVTLICTGEIPESAKGSDISGILGGLLDGSPDEDA